MLSTLLKNEKSLTIFSDGSLPRERTNTKYHRHRMGIEYYTIQERVTPNFQLLDNIIS